MNTKTIILTRLVSTFILALSLFPGFAFSAAIKIMPLGDSITRGLTGSTDSSGYRKYLYDLLVEQNGYDIDFVGSLQDGPTTFDNHHEGHTGWHADGVPSESILPAVQSFLTANPADIVLLHIGTNDISTGQSPASVATEIESILNEIDSYEQDAGKEVWVVLALIINRATDCSYRSQTASLNDFLYSIYYDRQLSGDRIAIVDMETETGAGLDYRIRPTGDMYDCLHPYATGYEKMAEEWFQGFLDILPRARAGDDRDANPGITVILDGSGSSDSLASITSYSWKQTAGSPIVEIAEANTSRASFTAPNVIGGAALTFELSITDSKQFMHKDTCIVNLNGPPVAVAGTDQVVNMGKSVKLDGTGSTDPGGDIAEYQWVQTAGNPVTLTNSNTSEAAFTAPSVGSGGADLSFELTVTDNRGAKDTATCVVHVNGPPVADAGADQRVIGGAEVILDGTRSIDADGSIVAYRWEQVGGSPVVTLLNGDRDKATFTMPENKSGDAGLVFQLTITDDLGVESSDTVVVEINGPPQADAGGDQRVEAEAIVVLDGSGSTDDGSEKLSFAWVQTSGSVVALSDPASAKPSFSAPREAASDIALVFLLTVTDAGGLQSTDSCTVTVIPEHRSSESGGGGGGGGGCFITTAGDRSVKGSAKEKF